jgi:hypothetical protein
MTTLFILDVPEFRPLAEALGATSGLEVQRIGAFTRVSAPGTLAVTRASSGLDKAVWFGALTGGYQGRIERFDEDELRIAAA